MIRRHVPEIFSGKREGELGLQFDGGSEKARKTRSLLAASGSGSGSAAKLPEHAPPGLGPLDPALPSNPPLKMQGGVSPDLVKAVHKFNPKKIKSMEEWVSHVIAKHGPMGGQAQHALQFERDIASRKGELHRIKEVRAFDLYQAAMHGGCLGVNDQISIRAL